MAIGAVTVVATTGLTTTTTGGFIGDAVGLDGPGDDEGEEDDSDDDGDDDAGDCGGGETLRVSGVDVAGVEGGEGWGWSHVGRERISSVGAVQAGTFGQTAGDSGDHAHVETVGRLGHVEVGGRSGVVAAGVDSRQMHSSRRNLGLVGQFG